MNRRNFLQISSAAAGAPVSTVRNPPNIVILLTDDQRRDALGAAGNRIIYTPHQDRMAAEGVTFENNYCTTAICMSSRASIFTGLYMRAHGINTFNDPLRAADFERSYPVLLRKAGYRLGFIGKYGVGDDALPVSSYDFWRGFPGQGTYFPKEGPPTHLTNVMAGQAVDFLATCRRGEPFCLNVSFKAPHAQDGDPRQYPYDPALENLYRDVRIPSPTGQDFDRLPDFIRNSEGRARWERRFETPNHYQEMVKAYYRLVTGVDNAVGRIRAALAERGLDRNTILIFTSDNGAFLGEHGMADKWLMYEEAIRTPLMICGPGIRPRRRAETSLNIDLAPTILELAGVPRPAGTQGRSLAPLIEGRSPAWRHEWFYEHHFAYGGKIPRSEGIHTGSWKYVRYMDSKPLYEQLFDLKSDPAEIQNLAGAREHQKRLEEMRKRWELWTRTLSNWKRDTDWHEPAAS